MNTSTITHGRECARCRAGVDRSYDCPLQTQVNKGAHSGKEYAVYSV